MKNNSSAQAGDDLQRILERFQCLIDSLTDACFGIDFSWRYIFFNSTAELLAGVGRGEVIGRDIFTVFPDIASTPIFGEYKTVMRNRSPRRVVGKLTLPDGRKGRFSILISPIPEGIMCVVKEVDERAMLMEELKESEAFLMALLNAPHDHAIMVTDPADRIAFANDAARILFGYSRAEMAGKNISMLIPQFSWEKLLGLSDASPGEERSVEAILPNKSGSVLPGLLRTYPVYSALKMLTARVTFIQDLTARKEQETRRLQSTRVKAIAELTKDVAHNFNNLLGSMLGCAQMLKMNESITRDAKVARLLDQILFSGNRMTELVQNMLTFTGIMDTMTVQPFTSDDLGAMLQEAIELVQPALEEHMRESNIEVRIHYTYSTLPKLDYLNENLRTAVIQILLNAIEATETDGEIEVACEYLPQGPDGLDAVLVRVEDEGRGMDEETLERAMDPLFSTKKKVGVGLGLTMAYGFITRAGGSLTLQSKPHRGTIVRIWLPGPGTV